MWPSFSHYELRRGVFTPEQCAQLIACHRALPQGDGTIGQTRESGVWWLPYAMMPELLGELALVGFRSSPAFDLAKAPDYAQLTRYTPGQHYDWHMDLGAGAMSLRKLSIVAELAGAEAGGGLEIFHGEERNNRVQLRAGDVAVFPSFVMHRAVHVVRGTRWSLVMWLLGDQPLR
jgi:Rps23 Pro-64 3,4-dihydroxylase Tpa1-like proline 4-hydroxylase